MHLTISTHLEHGSSDAYVIVVKIKKIIQKSVKQTKENKIK